MKTLIFFLAIFATTDASCNATGTGTDPYSNGFNANCPYAYQTGCKLGQQEYGEFASDTAEIFLGAQLSFFASATAGFACGLCESSLFGNGNTTTPGNGKGAHCDNSDCDREAECCPKTGPQCGSDAFQQAYNEVQFTSCNFGYQVAKGNPDQSSTQFLGAYSAVLICGGEGFFDCSSFFQSLNASGFADQIPLFFQNFLSSISNIINGN